MPVILTVCLIGLVWLICQTYSERRRAYKDCYLVHQTTLDLMRKLGCPDSSIELMKDSWTSAAVTGSLKELQDATLAAHSTVLAAHDIILNTKEKPNA
jgi:hypothetical protein